MEQHDWSAGAPALYRTRVTHLRRAPVHHYFEHRGYCWYVDVDALPELPAWLRAFARIDAADHFDGAPETTLRRRIDALLASRGVDPPGGTVTALLQARVLGYVYNPLSLYWCHDTDGALRHVVAEVHNARGGRHVYVLPPDFGEPMIVQKRLYASPFNGQGGHYLVRAPRPGADLNVTISLHRDDQPAFVATLRGERRPASVAQLVRMQVVAPLAPLMARFAMRMQGLTLRLRRVPVMPEAAVPQRQAVGQL